MALFFTLAFCFVSLVAADCPCFVGMWLTPNGLGNRVAETIAGWQMADELGCEYLFDREGFERGSVHGSYHGVAEFLGISRGLRTWHEVRHLIDEEVELHEWPAARIDNKCNVLYKAAHTQICRFKNRYTTWCTYAIEWDQHKWRLRERFRSANPRFPSALRLLRSLTVAWHLRVGDIVPDRGNKQFFSSVAATLSQAALKERRSVQFHFVFRHDSREFPKDFAFISETVCARWACTRHWQQNVTESLHTLMSADVLVTSRSSFSYVAALYTRGLVLFETPKEECEHCYWLSEYMRVDKSGNVFNAEELTARISLILRSGRWRHRYFRSTEKLL